MPVQLIKTATIFSKLSLVYNHLNERVRKGQLYEEAWNNTSVELVEVAELHGRLFIVESFLDKVKSFKTHISKELEIVLQQLLELYAVHTALRCSGHLLRVSITQMHVEILIVSYYSMFR